jgi:hypothetical protein
MFISAFQHIERDSIINQVVGDKSKNRTLMLKWAENSGAWPSKKINIRILIYILSLWILLFAILPIDYGVHLRL